MMKRSPIATLVIAFVLLMAACDAEPAPRPRSTPTETPLPMSGVRVSTLPPPTTRAPAPGTPSPAPPAAGPTTGAAPGCTTLAAFIADVTVPDGSAVQPNSQFVKTWRIQNAGTCNWGAGFALVFVEGIQLDGPTVVSVPPTASGGVRDLSITLKAPASAGTYKGKWQLRTSGGVPLTALTVSIVVATTPTAAASPTVSVTRKATPVPTYAGTIDGFVGLWVIDENMSGSPERLQQLDIQRSDSQLAVSPATTFGSPYEFGYVGRVSAPYAGDRTMEWQFDDPARGHVTIHMTINKACNATVRLSYPQFSGKFIVYNIRSDIPCI